MKFEGRIKEKVLPVEVKGRKKSLKEILGGNDSVLQAFAQFNFINYL